MVPRLRSEKDALEALLRPPSVPSLSESGVAKASRGNIPDRALLSDSDAAALDLTVTNTNSSDQVSERLNRLYESLGPTIDAFADGMHKMGQYRDAADRVGGRVLAICAEKLALREAEGRKRALPVGQGGLPHDLGGVLRSLSRVDR